MGKDQERERRLAEALRENLRRRKQQQRGQEPGEPHEQTGADGGRQDPS